MSITSTTPGRRARVGRADALAAGTTLLFVSLVVIVPLAAVATKSFSDGFGPFWQSAFTRQARSALVFTLWSSLAVTALGAVFGTLTAWVLVRDHFPGKSIINVLIDLPFALPTIVAGLTLLALYGQAIAYTKWAVLLALLFVTLPFVVRSVQPVLIEIDTEMEEAAASLGASRATTFRRIILPNLAPAIISGSALAFARAVGEFGSVVLVSGNVPFDTQVSSVYAFKQLESDNVRGAAAVAVVLMVISLAILIGLRAWERRHTISERTA